MWERMRRQGAAEATCVQQDQQPRRQRQQHQSTQTSSQQHHGTQATSPVGVDCGGNSAEHWYAQFEENSVENDFFKCVIQCLSFRRH